MSLDRRAFLAAAPLLLAPGCARSASDSGSGVAQGELHDGLIFLRGWANGLDGWFLVDTGAPITLLDAAFAARAKVAAEGRETVRGVGGAMAALRAAPTAFALDGAPKQRLKPSVIDLSRLGQRMGVALAGVAGSDFLSAHAVTFDYRTGRIGFDVGRAPPATAIPMRVGRTPYVRAVVAHGGRAAEAEFQLDTGANTAVVLWRDFARRAFPGARVGRGAAAGIGGQVAPTSVGRLDSLTVGGVVIPDLVANFADETRPDDAGRDYGGVIGGPAWTSFSITVDYPAGRFWVA